MRPGRRLFCLVLSSVFACPAGVAAQRWDAPPQIPINPPYVPTPEDVVSAMLKVARVSPRDVVYDLGCGDGRIIIEAARRYGARGVGVDINAEHVRAAQENARNAGVTSRVEIRQQDLFETDLSKATVVTLYLLPDVNLKLRPKLLKELKPGTRVVSHEFHMGDWKPRRELHIGGSKVYYWVAPGKKRA